MSISADQVAFITGADRGIGRALAQRLRARGVKLALFSNNGENLRKTAREERWSEPEVLLDVFDVADSHAVRCTVDRSLAHFGRVDHLLNVAGILYFGGVLQCTEVQWDRTLNTNAKGYFLMAREVLPKMQEAGAGSIVNVSSIWGKRGAPATLAYGVSKFAVEGLTKSLQEEVRPWGVKVTSIVLDKVDTDFRENLAGHIDYTAEQRARMIQPADVVDAIVWFLESATTMLPTSIELDAWLWK